MKTVCERRKKVPLTNEKEEAGRVEFLLDIQESTQLLRKKPIEKL